MAIPLRALLVGDSEDTRELVLHELRRFGYDATLERAETEAAMKIALSREAWHVVIAEYSPPGFGDADALGVLKETSPDLPFIFLSDVSGEDLAVEAVKAGASDYILKNNIARLVPAIRRALDEAAVRRSERAAAQALRESEARFHLLTETVEDVFYRYKLLPVRGFSYVSRTVRTLVGYNPQEFYDDPDLVLRMVCDEDRHLIEDMLLRQIFRERFAVRWRHRDGSLVWTEQRVVPMRDDSGTIVAIEGVARDISELKRAEEDLRNSVERLRQTLVGTVEAMALAVEMRDPFLSGHQRRVAKLASAIAARMGLGSERADVVWLAGAIHDVGMINVPAEILGRSGRISDVEFALIKPHPRIGAELLKTIDFPWPIGDIVRQHHERLDGSGYPDGLRAEEIVPEARIIAVADVVEAMASHRPYRPAFRIDEAVEEISRGSGFAYDPVAVEACRAVIAGENGVAFEWG